jgi:limonene-1,2-epoxide hydrolase
MSNLDVVNAFMKAASSGDYDGMVQYLADDVEYQNMPIPAPLTGLQAVRDGLAAMMGGFQGSEWIVHREAESGDLVFNERTDRFLRDGQWIDLPVAGVFQLAGGKIVLWRDYFDVGTFANQAGAS